MRRSFESPFNVIVVVFVMFMIHGCSTEPDSQPPVQTVILDIQIKPDPVTVNDTATFTCIIEDSLDDRFSFDWSFGANSAEDTTTQQNSIPWKAPDTAGTFLHSVTATNGAQDSLPASQSFNVRVVGQVN